MRRIFDKIFILCPISVLPTLQFVHSPSLFVLLMTIPPQKKFFSHPFVNVPLARQTLCEICSLLKHDNSPIVLTLLAASSHQLNLMSSLTYSFRQEATHDTVSPLLLHQWLSDALDMVYPLFDLYINTSIRS